MRKLLNPLQELLDAHERWHIWPNPFGSADCPQMHPFFFFLLILALGQVLPLQKSGGEYLRVLGFCPGAEAEPEREPVGAEEPRRGCGKLGCASRGKDL